MLPVPSLVPADKIKSEPLVEPRIELRVMEFFIVKLPFFALMVNILPKGEAVAASVDKSPKNLM